MQVRRVVFRGKRAIGLLVESGGQTFTVEAGQIILSAGAVGSPHLLLLSGVGLAGQLESLGIPVVQDIPGVGRNLKDHPKVYVAWEAGDGFVAPSNRGASAAALRLTAPGSHLRNDLGISLSALAAPRVKGTAPALQAQGPRSEGEDAVSRHIEMMVALLLPESRGELTPTSSGHRVQPAMDYNYLAGLSHLEFQRPGRVEMCKLRRYISANCGLESPESPRVTGVQARKSEETRR